MLTRTQHIPRTDGNRCCLFGVLLAAFLLGTCGQLGLTDPLWFGSLLLKPSTLLARASYAAFAVQALAVTGVLMTGGRLAMIWRGVDVLGRGRVALLLILLLASLVAPMGFMQRAEWSAFAKQGLVTAAFLGVNLVNLTLLAMLVPERLDRAIAAAERLLLPRADTGRHGLPWLAALWVFAATLLLSVFAFDRMPRVPDEVSYLFHACYFVQGNLYAAAPPEWMQGALQYDWISMQDGKWFSIFPPGWPAVLAIGVAAGVPFLVNPILAALTIPIGYDLARRLVSARFAAVVTVLLAVSPWYLAMSASFMSHTLTLFLVLAAWLLLAAEKKHRVLGWFAAGCLMGILFLTRPLDGVVVGGLTGFWAMSRVDLRALSGWISVAAYGVGCLVIGALIFPYNHLLTGNALVTPIDQYFDLLWHPGANRLGFGADIGSPNNWGGVDIWLGHSLPEALIQAQFNLKSMNAELLGWAIGSLALLYIHLIWGRITRLDWCMLVLMGAIVAAYGLYWFNGGFYIGPRYWFMALWPGFFLIARGLQTLIMIMYRISDKGRGGIISVAILLCIVAVGGFMPWRGLAKYWEFRGFNGDYRAVAASGAIPSDALVFVKDGDMGEYGSAFMLNMPDLKGRIFLKDQGPEMNAHIASHFEGRPVWHAVRGADDHALLLSRDGVAGERVEP
ncbi:MAG: glycosyltransferase family 39 protein [Sphingobium sp.]|nr:glycosyltransferase family 39 protein [Sphingobium sp.]MCP5397810.1 glycosyltransferase family 39 protein [Sphingomonas sp.]